MSDPVVVKPNQGAIDVIQTVARLVVVILSTAPAAALLIKKHDLVGLYDYFQSQPGVALLAAISGLASLAYGIYKSFKRGKQIATVAANPYVPSSVAEVKQ